MSKLVKRVIVDKPLIIVEVEDVGAKFEPLIDYLISGAILSLRIDSHSGL